jgi:CRP-like cAMP-binding protein
VSSACSLSRVTRPPTVSDAGRIEIGQQPPPAEGYSIDLFERYLDEMEGRARAMRAVDDYRAAFELTYLVFSRQVLAALKAERFEDMTWAVDIACRFVEVYGQQLELWEARHPALCRAWRTAFEAIEEERINVLQAVLLAINAHINYDLAFVALGACRHAGDLHEDDTVERALGLSQAGVPVVRYRDFLVINQLEWEAIEFVQDTVLREFSAFLYWGNRLTGRRSRLVGQRLLMETRDTAWYRTTLLVHARDAGERAIVARLIDAHAASLADLVGSLTLRPGDALERAVGWLRRGERIDPELQTGLVEMSCRNPVVAGLLLRELAASGADPVSVAVTLLSRDQYRLAGSFGRMALRLAPRRRRQRFVRFLRGGSDQAVSVVEAMLDAGLSVRALPRGVPLDAVRARWRAQLDVDTSCLRAPEIGSHDRLYEAVAMSVRRSESRLRAIGDPGPATAAQVDPLEDVASYLENHPDAWVRTCARTTTLSDPTGQQEPGDTMTSMIERVLFLKETNVFMEVDMATLVHVAERLEPRTHGEGEVFVRQGEPTGGVYLIETGQVAVSQVRDGESVPIATLGPRDSVGEMSVLTDEPAIADCTASTPLTGWFLPSRLLSGLLHQHPRLGVGLVRVLSQRLMATTQRVGAGITKPV